MNESDQDLKKWPFFTMDDGEEICVEEIALAHLLLDDVLFANAFRYVYDPWPGEKEPEVPKLQPRTITLFVNCNDEFAWACADAESLTTEELPVLYKMWHADKKWGSAKWVALKRKLRPQWPFVKLMIQDNAWDAELEALPSLVGEKYDHGWTVEAELVSKAAAAEHERRKAETAKI